MRYFSQSDVSGNLYADSLFRQEWRNSLLVEEFWNSRKHFWQSTTDLTGMMIHGECTLVELTHQQVSEFFNDTVILKSNHDV